MSKYVESSIANQIFELCTQFYQNEKIFENSSNNAEYNCYLIFYII